MIVEDNIQPGMIVRDDSQPGPNVEQGHHQQLNQVSAPLHRGEKGSEQDPFSSTYSPSVWDRLSLDLRIARDFENESVFMGEKGGKMQQLSGEQRGEIPTN